MRLEKCVCSQAPRLSISTRLIVITHSKEWRRTTNTGHLARLAVNGGEVRLHGLPHRSVNSVGVDARSPATLVLYPGRGAEALTPTLSAALPRPLTLLVPDGNWNQTQHMMRRVPMLRQAKPIRLDGPTLDVRCLRHNRAADRMSTFEAIALALGILEGRETEARLLKFFHHFLERTVHNSRKAACRWLKAQA
jgi:DTW domain-containing protein YfiP